MIPNFKDKSFLLLNKEQKLAFAERVCMDFHERLKNQQPSSTHTRFFKYWMEEITRLESPSNSPYLSRYVYNDVLGLCVEDKEGRRCSIKNNDKEGICFIQNVANHIPFRSPIIDNLNLGRPLKELEEKGILADAYGVQLDHQGLGIKKGKPKDPNSLAQRVARGEITRYEAYVKKIVPKEDDGAL